MFKFSALLILFEFAALAQFTVSNPTSSSTQTGVFSFTVSGVPTGTAAVQYLVDNSRFAGPATAAPWSLSYDVWHMANGNYQASAIAFDSTGKVLATSPVVKFTVAVPGRQGSGVTMPSPGDGTTQTGTITLSATATPAPRIDPATGSLEVVEDCNFAVDGLQVYVWNNFLNGSKSFTYSFDTTALANGPHEVVLGCFHNLDSQSWIGRARAGITVNNGHTFRQVLASFNRLYLNPGALQGLSLSAVYTDGQVVAAPAPTYSSSDATVATVAANGTVTAVAPGVAVITASSTIGSITRSTSVKAIVDSPAPAFAHFGTWGGILYSYEAGRSFFMVAPYFLDTNTINNTPGLAALVHAAGVNTLTTGFYSNPADMSPVPTAYRQWAGPFNTSWSQIASITAANGFSLFLTGDDLARTPAELYNTLAGPFSIQSVQHALASAKAAGAVAVAMVDEVQEAGAQGSVRFWGDNPRNSGGAWQQLNPPIPDTAFTTLMDRLNSLPARPPISWPVSAVASTAAVTNWMGDRAFSNFSSIYSTAYERRYVHPWGQSANQIKSDFDTAFEGRLPYIQRTQPIIANIGITGDSYIKNGLPGSGDGGFNPGQDTFEGGQNLPSNISGQIFYMVARGVAGLRPYGYDNIYWKVERGVTGANGGRTQVGADPYAVGVPRWRAMSASLNAIQNNLQSLLQPLTNAIDLGPDIVTGARFGALSRMLITVNCSQSVQAATVNFSPYQFPGGTITRTRINGEIVATDTVQNVSSFAETWQPGDTVFYVFQ